MTLIGRLLGEAADHDCGLDICAHVHLVQGMSGVLHLAALMPREPLPLAQQEAQRPDPNEVICKALLKDSSIRLQFGSGPGLRELGNFSFSPIWVHFYMPFVAKE